MKGSSGTDDELLRIYNEIDAFMRQQYKHSGYIEHTNLLQELAKSNRVIARHQQELRAIAQLRNILVHNPFTSFDDPIAYASQAVVTRYGQIRDALLNPYDALSIAVPVHKIYTVEPSTSLSEVITNMNENTYTHIPVIRDGKMIGVFSENTLLSHVANSGEVIITNDLKMSDFADLIPIESQRNEKFVFLHRKASLSEVFEIFNKAIKVRQRIGMVFITENGKSDEKPLGIITAWDLASPEFEL